eukprot:CAMPEP_0117435904 /NCGR_PEP_ID=MMETSP0759-20121206/727_1 /TAXON_ID=63605 /ORGANISM="Percolomonas cosmopolitus, Strain WS" /LENGTH=62 /DNA_ID=CAMNT_0005227477 /DNA_START=262 /DNA_END=450 /DNA_ORIENTATION=-
MVMKVGIAFEIPMLGILLVVSGSHSKWGGRQNEGNFSQNQIEMWRKGIGAPLKWKVVNAQLN